MEGTAYRWGGDCRSFSGQEDNGIYVPLPTDSPTALAISRLLWDFHCESWRYSKGEEMETLTGIVMLKQPKGIQDIKTLRIFASGLLSQSFS